MPVGGGYSALDLHGVVEVVVVEAERVVGGGWVLLDEAEGRGILEVLLEETATLNLTLNFNCWGALRLQDL